jgi:Flp pilus assembly protein TadG
LAPTFSKSQSGLAAVEFAFVLPLMLAIYLGIVELSNGLSASRKIDLVAHAMSDLTGQTTGGSGEAAITDAGMQQIFLAGAALIAPLSATSLTITISEVNIQLISGAYKATVDWSVSYNGGTLRNGVGCTLNTYLNAADVAPVSPTSMPTSFTNATLTPTLGPVIVADVTYSYNLGLGNIVEAWLPTGAILMKRTSYSPVRNQYNNPNVSPALYNHIESPTTATSWTTAITGSTNVNCLGHLTPALQ